MPDLLKKATLPGFKILGGSLEISVLEELTEVSIHGDFSFDAERFLPVNDHFLKKPYFHFFKMASIRFGSTFITRIKLLNTVLIILYKLYGENGEGPRHVSG